MLASWLGRTPGSLAMPIVFRSAPQFKDSTKRVIADARKADVVITVRGIPTAFLRVFTEQELEGALLMHSPTTRRLMKRALEQIDSGRGVSLGTLTQQLAAGGQSPGEPLDVSGAVAGGGVSWQARRRRSYRPIVDGRRRR
jgi:hypothetical protein